MAMRDELWTLFLATRDDPEVGAGVLAGTGERALSAGAAVSECGTATSEVGAVVLAGSGERAFGAGADVSEWGTAPSYIEARSARHERDVWGLMLSLEKPLIAAVHGYALGAGCEMSLLCDIRIAAED